MARSQAKSNQIPTASIRSEFTRRIVERDALFAPMLEMFDTQRALTAEMANMLLANIERFAAIQSDVTSALMVGRPGEAFGFLSEILQVVNAAMVAQPSWSAKIGGYLQTLRPMIGEIGRDFGATGFTIEYGVPGGISVAFHFSVDPDSGARAAA